MLGVKQINAEGKNGVVEAWLMGELRIGGFVVDPDRYLYSEIRSGYVVVYKLTGHVTQPHIKADGIQKFYGELTIHRYVQLSDYQNWLKNFKLCPYV
jgi:hypothetical protein